MVNNRLQSNGNSGYIIFYIESMIKQRDILTPNPISSLDYLNLHD